MPDPIGINNLALQKFDDIVGSDRSIGFIGKKDNGNFTKEAAHRHLKFLNGKALTRLENAPDTNRSVRFELYNAIKASLEHTQTDQKGLLEFVSRELGVSEDGIARSELADRPLERRAVRVLLRQVRSDEVRSLLNAQEADASLSAESKPRRDRLVATLKEHFTGIDWDQMPLERLSTAGLRELMQNLLQETSTIQTSTDVRQFIAEQVRAAAQNHPQAQDAAAAGNRPAVADDKPALPPTHYFSAQRAMEENATGDTDPVYEHVHMNGHRRLGEHDESELRSLLSELMTEAWSWERRAGEDTESRVNRLLNRHPELMAKLLCNPGQLLDGLPRIVQFVAEKLRDAVIKSYPEVHVEIAVRPGAEKTLAANLKNGVLDSDTRAQAIRQILSTISPTATPLQNYVNDALSRFFQGQSITVKVPGPAQRPMPAADTLAGMLVQTVKNYIPSLDRAAQGKLVAAMMMLPSEKQYLTHARFEEKPGGYALEILSQILKGMGPVMQQLLLQFNKVPHLPPLLRGVLNDLQVNAERIPDRYVQARLLGMVAESGGKVDCITIEEDLGVDPLSQTLLCRVTNTDGSEHKAVIRLIRPDIREAIDRERPVFEQLMEQMPQMRPVIEQVFAQIDQALNLKNEAVNLTLAAGYETTGARSLPLTCTALDDSFAVCADAIAVKPAGGMVLSKIFMENQEDIDKLSLNYNYRDADELRTRIAGRRRSLKEFIEKSFLATAARDGFLLCGSPENLITMDANTRRVASLSLTGAPNGLQLNTEHTNALRDIVNFSASAETAPSLLDRCRVFLSPQMQEKAETLRETMQTEVHEILKNPLMQDNTCGRIDAILTVLTKNGIEFTPVLQSIQQSMAAMSGVYNQMSEQIWQVFDQIDAHGSEDSQRR